MIKIAPTEVVENVTSWRLPRWRWIGMAAGVRDGYNRSATYWIMAGVGHVETG